MPQNLDRIQLRDAWYSTRTPPVAAAMTVGGAA